MLIRKIGRIFKSKPARQNQSQRTTLHDVLTFIDEANSTQVRCMANAINNLSSIKRNGKEIVC